MFIMILTIAIIFGLLQPTCGLLLDTYKPAHHPGGNDTITFMTQRLDKLQEQMVQQNKTLEMQGKMMGQLLNISNQSPSTQSLSNELSILQIYVQRIMDEYHRLSNISDATDLALKINSMTTSVRILTISLSSQEQIVRELKQEVSVLNQSLSTLFSREHHNENQLSTFSSDLHTTKSRLSSLQGTVSQNQQHVSTLSSNLSTLSSDLHSVQSSLSSLQTTVSRNQQYSSSHISSLTNQYSILSTTLQNTKDRVSTLEYNLEASARIIGGNYSGVGRLEVRYRGSWGTVCDDGFNSNSAKVVCRQLGYPWIHATAKGSAYFGQGSGDIVLDDVSCRGDESLLALCRHQEFGQDNCGHSEDVGVVCLDIRLVGRTSHNQGRVEIKLGNTWGTVCDDGWDVNDARVVCRMLGYSGTVEAFSEAHFGQGSGQIWLDNVSCTGSESSIALCPSNGFGTHNCGHIEDAGVICH